MPNFYDPSGYMSGQEDWWNTQQQDQPWGQNSPLNNIYTNTGGGTEVPEPQPQTPDGPPAGMMQYGTNPDGSPRYVKGMPGYDPEHNPYAGSWQFDETGFDWYWLPDKGQGRPENYTGGPVEAGGQDGPSFGGPIDPFSETYTTLARPQEIAEPFRLPTADEFMANSPGYEARFKMGLQGRERSAAARGSLLSGGTLKALNRYGQDYASGEYSNYVNQLMGARGLNDAEYQSNVNNALNQFGTRYKSYLDLIGNNRNAQQDYWSNQMDLVNAALRSAAAGQPLG